jgi:capsular exopolysaccharide synthesis family protein
MEEENFFKETGESNIFRKLINNYLPFWPLFVITTSICVAIAFLDLRSQVPVYVAAAKVLLKDPQKGGGDSKVLDALNIFSEKKIVDNEIVVLRSPDIMQEVVKQLNLYSIVYNKGNVRTEELYKENSPMDFIAVNKDSINFWGTYFFSVDWKNKTIQIDNKTVPFNDTFLINNTPIRLQINEGYNTSVVGKNYFVQFSSPAGAAGGLSGGLQISPYSYSSTILNVSINIPVPEKGRDILNKLFEIYNKNAIEDKTQIADQTLRFIDDRLVVVTSQLDSVEKNIANYKSRESIVNLGSQATNYLDKVKDLDKQNTDLDLKLEALNNLVEYVKSKGKNPGTVPSLLILSDPTLTALLDRLYTAETKAETLQSVTGEKSDALLLANAEVSRIRNDLIENMSNIRTSLMLIKQEINNQISQNNLLLHDVPEKERAFLDISRQQSIKNDIYTFLLQKREETAISSASSSADLKVIESPVSYGPISPVAKNYYLTGLIIGILLAAFLLMIKEAFNRTVLFRSEIDDKIKAPLMGELLQVREKSSIVILDGKRTVIAEQFRTVRTNLNFMGLNENHNTLMITSSISGEGKTFVAINLAISLTLTGKKVAIMEMDLRKPKLSKMLKVNKSPGITNYLIGKASLEEICRQTEIPNLYVVSAGAIPPNPTELIQGEKFRELINELKERYDYLILDTAPVSPVTDAQLLQEFADINMFVIRHGVTPRHFLTLIETLHKQNKFKNMCVIFNGIKPRGFHIYGYALGGYGNGYGYGYGYGYGGEYGGGYYAEENLGIRSIFKFFGKRN